MKNNIFTKKGMKTSKDIADINENDFNISNFSPYIAYFTSNNSSNVNYNLYLDLHKMKHQPLP